MDLRLSTDPYESFRIFQGRILELYLAMTREFKFQVVDANQGVEAQQAMVRQIVSSRIDLDSFRRNGGELPTPMPSNVKTKWRRETTEEPSFEDREAEQPQ